MKKIKPLKPGKHKGVYMIVRSADKILSRAWGELRLDLESEVSAYMKDGWKPIGSPTQIKTMSGSTDGFLIQAMTK